MGILTNLKSKAMLGYLSQTNCHRSSDIATWGPHEIYHIYLDRVDDSYSHHLTLQQTNIATLWLFNIAMENGP